MKLADLKSEFHHLIDQIDDADVLEQFYEALNRSTKKPSIWESLTEDQRSSILDAYDESEDDANLVPFSTIISKMKK